MPLIELRLVPSHRKIQTPVLGNATCLWQLKRGLCVFWYVFNVDLCSATSMESSRRVLLNDMAERMPILKNNQNTYHLRFGFTPRYSIPKIHLLFCIRTLQCIDRDFLG